MAAEVVNRPTPWSVVFGAVAERYQALGEIPTDPTAFSRHPAAQRLLSDIESPDLLERAPVAAAEYQALLFADVTHWRHGRIVHAVTRAAIDGALAKVQAFPAAAGPPATVYVQLPLRAVWGQPDPEGPHEPLDGCYVVPLPRDELLVVAVMGLHAGRAGLSQITLTVRADALHEAAGALPDDPFAPAMPGGDAAGFRSVRTAAELLYLVRVALAPAAA